MCVVALSRVLSSRGVRWWVFVFNLRPGWGGLGRRTCGHASHGRTLLTASPSCFVIYRSIWIKLLPNISCGRLQMQQIVSCCHLAPLALALVLRADHWGSIPR